MKQKVYIGADFGGTKILTGVINDSGQILFDTVRVPTNGSDPAEDIIARLTGSVEKTLGYIDQDVYEVAGIGLGVTGPLDCKNGLILECPQLPSLHYFPLRSRIESQFSLPVFMNNDANCMIYGEALFGSGNGKNSVVGFTLGTGLGCAIVLNKKILNGYTESAGEIWTSPYKDGIIEDFVCGAGVSRIYRCISGKDRSAYEISRLAGKDDLEALETWKEFGRHLSFAMAWTVNLIDPEVIILGGSIANAYEYFSGSMMENLRRSVCPATAEKLNIVRTDLGDNAGVIGAASLAL